MSCNSKAPITLKQGQSFSLTCRVGVYDGAGAWTPDDISAATITSHLRTANDILIQNFIVVKDTVNAGFFTMSSLDTSAWTVGTLYCDLKIIKSGIVSYTDTFIVLVDKSVTHA